jgi:capsular polysaccharide biosynthesis protein
MALRDYVAIIMRRWWLVLLPAALAVIWSVLSTPAAGAVSYTVTMRFAAGLPPEPRRTDAYSYDGHYNWLASEYITRALAQAVETGEFAKNLSQRLAAKGIVVPVGAIRSEYLASYMKVTVAWPTPEAAVDIARAVDAELRENSARYWPQLQDLGPGIAPVRLLDEPVAAAAPPPLRSRFDLPVRALLGLAAGVLFALAWQFLDPLIRRKEDIEWLGLPVITQVR